MHELLEKLDESQRRKLEAGDPLEWMDPMLATLTDERFSEEDWIYERKLDGERCLIFAEGGKKVRLMSRNQKHLNNQYPELVEALQAMPEDMMLDGEIVAFDGALTSFSKLQNRMHVQDPNEALRSDVKVFCYLFDILYLDGYITAGLSQRTRKSLLKSAVQFEDPLRYMPHRNHRGEEYYRDACKKGWEGVIAKDAWAAYVHGRSKKWLKFKCIQQQEFVIGGYTDPRGKRSGFGALLLGYYENDKLRYAGRVGTGFDEELLERLMRMMQPLEQKAPAFEDPENIEDDVHWIQPEIVAEVGFEEWTHNDRLRQPRFLGIREDIYPKEVIREKAR